MYLLYIDDDIVYFLQKMQMFLLKSLCTGTTSMSKTDISTFTAILKFAKVPSIVRQESDAGNYVHDYIKVYCHDK